MSDYPGGSGLYVTTRSLYKWKRKVVLESEKRERRLKMEEGATSQGETGTSRSWKIWEQVLSDPPERNVALPIPGP